jgi:hypothetical protein
VPRVQGSYKKGIVWEEEADAEDRDEEREDWLRRRMQCAGRDHCPPDEECGGNVHDHRVFEATPETNDDDTKGVTDLKVDSRFRSAEDDIPHRGEPWASRVIGRQPKSLRRNASCSAWRIGRSGLRLFAVLEAWDGVNIVSSGLHHVRNWFRSGRAVSF